MKMNSINPEYEKKILLDVIAQMENPAITIRKQGMVRNTLFGLGSTGVVVTFLLAMNDTLHPLAAAFAAAMSGVFIGLAYIFDFTLKQWPLTCKHIDLDSVRKRLGELEYPGSD